MTRLWLWLEPFAAVAVTLLGVGLLAYWVGGWMPAAGTILAIGGLFWSATL